MPATSTEPQSNRQSALASAGRDISGAVHLGSPLRRGALIIVRSNKSAVSLSIIVLAVVLLFRAHGFAASANLQPLAITVAVAAVVGWAQTAALSIGHFNLAVGAVGGVTGMFLGWLLQDAHVELALGIVASLAFGVALGLVQGALVAYSGINPFVVSLGLASVFTGGMLVLSQSNSFSSLPSAFVALGRNTVFGVPLLFYVALGIGAIFAVQMNAALLGRRLIATGANPRAAALSGISVRQAILSAHALSGLLAAAAGIMLAAELGSSQPYGGNDWLLGSFAAPVLGGTLLSGGRVSVLGTLLGACFLSLIDNGLIILGVNSYWYQVFLGGIILIAIGLERGRLSLLGRRQWVR